MKAMNSSAISGSSLMILCARGLRNPRHSTREHHHEYSATIWVERAHLDCRAAIMKPFCSSTSDWSAMAFSLSTGFFGLNTNSISDVPSLSSTPLLSRTKLLSALTASSIAFA